MLIKIFSLKGFFNFRSQLCENTIIGISVVVATLTLVHQSDIDTSYLYKPESRRYNGR